MNLCIVLPVTVAALMLAGCSVAGSTSRSAGDDPKALFARMEEAIKASNEDLFREQWHAKGYTQNLVGGSGLAGSRVYTQGTHKKWFLKPDLSKTREVEGVVVVPADVWSWEQERAVDHVDVVIARDGGRLVVLGAGEDPEQVDALARRFAKGEPLAPPQ